MKNNMIYFDFAIIRKGNKIEYIKDFEASPYLEFSEFLYVTCGIPKKIENDKLSIEIISPYRKFILPDEQNSFTLEQIGITNGTLIRVRNIES